MARTTRRSFVIGLVVLVAGVAIGRELWFKYRVDRAQSLLRGGDPAGAEQLYNQALRIKPGSVDALIGRAAAREQSGDLVGALAQLREAIARQPREARLHLELAHALAGEPRPASDGTRQSYDEAVKAYQQAATLRPNDARMLNDVGLGLRSIGRIDLAIPIFQQASMADRKWGGPDVNLADTYREVQRYEDALALFRELETRTLEVPAYRIHNAMAQVYMDSGKPRDAELVLRRATEMNPEYAPVRMTLALALMEQRRYAEATTELEQAARLDPQPDRMFFMCQLYALQKRADEVLDCLSRAASAGASVDAIRSDALFTFVRDREQFRQLVGSNQAR